MRVLPLLRARARAGFTLVELMVAAVMLSAVLGAVAFATLRGQGAYETGRTVAELELSSERSLDRIASELRGARRLGLQPNPLPPVGAASLQYQVNEGFVAGAVVWSSLRSIGFEYDPGETNDGTDEDGDGLIDEGRVVLTRDLGGPNQQRVVITNWVRELDPNETVNGIDDDGNGLRDDGGLSFSATGDTLRIRLTLERFDPERRRITRTLETAIVLRN